ncbi:hypothetical protein BC829DRAFT_398903 [Chytridium lagenaria]|nr:hypothetical protein BC829DRAFT_398903 [Chytridium lagenaria]
MRPLNLVLCLEWWGRSSAWFYIFFFHSACMMPFYFLPFVFSAIVFFYPYHPHLHSCPSHPFLSHYPAAIVLFFPSLPTLFEGKSCAVPFEKVSIFIYTFLFNRLIDLPLNPFALIPALSKIFICSGWSYSCLKW